MVCFNSHAQEVKLSGSRNAVRKSGDVLACLTPAASLATVLILQDWQGLKQGALAGVSTVGMTLCAEVPGKERTSRRQRQSFVSFHAYLRIVYGRCFYPAPLRLEMGYPAYAVATM